MKLLALVTECFGGRGGIAQYNRDGYYVAKGFFDAEEIEVLSAYARADVAMQDSARLVGDRLYIACTTPAYGAELYWVQICPADFTLDFAVTVDDVVGFVGAFEAGSSDADLDDGSGTMTLDGAVTIEDLLFFLDRFATGC